MMGSNELIEKMLNSGRVTPDGKISFDIYNIKGTEYALYTDVKEVIAFFDILDKIDEEDRKKLENKLRTIEHKLEKATKREESFKREIAEQKEELKTYDKIYGNYVSPHAIIQLFFKGRVGKYTPANTKNFIKKNMKIQQKQLDYWINVFLDIGIFFYGANKELIANCEEVQAHNLLSANNGMIDKSLIE